MDVVIVYKRFPPPYSQPSILRQLGDAQTQILTNMERGEEGTGGVEYQRGMRGVWLWEGRRGEDDGSEEGVLV